MDQLPVGIDNPPAGMNHASIYNVPPIVVNHYHLAENQPRFGRVVYVKLNGKFPTRPARLVDWEDEWSWYMDDTGFIYDTTAEDTWAYPAEVNLNTKQTMDQFRRHEQVKQKAFNAKLKSIRPYRLPPKDDLFDE